MDAFAYGLKVAHKLLESKALEGFIEKDMLVSHQVSEPILWLTRLALKS